MKPLWKSQYEDWSILDAFNNEYLYYSVRIKAIDKALTIEELGEHIKKQLKEERHKILKRLQKWQLEWFNHD